MNRLYFSYSWHIKLSKVTACISNIDNLQKDLKSDYILDLLNLQEYAAKLVALLVTTVQSLSSANLPPKTIVEVRLASQLQLSIKKAPKKRRYRLQTQLAIRKARLRVEAISIVQIRKLKLEESRTSTAMISKRAVDEKRRVQKRQR